MGRARGHSPQAAATTVASGRFDAVVGARRGSVNAQTARDVAEQQVREDMLKDMLDRINGNGNQLQLGLRLHLRENGDPHSGAVLNLLAAAYREGAQQRPHTREYEKLCEDLESACNHCDHKGEYSDRKEMIGAVAHGDPVYWPGLTYPATRTLGNFLDATNEGEARELREPAQRTIITINNLSGKSPEDYQRLAPVFEGLATVLEHLPRDGCGVACTGMAKALLAAPTEMLAGPLQPLVQAFARRIRAERLTNPERNTLEQIKADQVLDSRLRTVFRPVSDLL